MYRKAKFLPAGDQSLVMEFGNTISPRINGMIRNMVKAIDNSPIDGITELIPTYRSLQIFYNPLKIDYTSLLGLLEKLENSLGDEASSFYRIFEIPTIYGGEYGPDIDFVSDHNNLSMEEVIEIHSSRDYLIYMLGFTPGFSYLGGMDERIATPRLENPRTKIPAGSTGIAGSQTGIYPIDSPGGWQLIGRTPIKLYNPEDDPPVLLKAGDYVRFKPVDEDEYRRIKDLVDRNEYEIRIIEDEVVRSE